MKVGVTGHRPQALGGFAPNPVQDYVRSRLQASIEMFKEAYPNLHLISGMALGVDQWSVEIALDLGVPFWAAVPFEGQEMAWPSPSREIYRRLLKKADQVWVINAGGYEPWKMFSRNQWIVDHSDHLIAVWDGRQSGGTWDAVQRAQESFKPVLRIDPTISENSGTASEV